MLRTDKSSDWTIFRVRNPIHVKSFKAVRYITRLKK